MLPLRLEPQDLHLEFYIRKWIRIDWRMFGFSGLRFSQVPLGSFAAPNGPGVIVYLPSICIAVRLVVALMQCVLKGSCSHSHIFLLDSLSVPYQFQGHE